MQDQSARRVPIATIAALLAAVSSAASAQSAAPFLVSVRGSMSTSADITDKFVFRVPAETDHLTIRVPIPADSIPSKSQTALSEQEQVGAITVVENKSPDAESNQRDSSGNLYRVLTYDHLSPGTITVREVMSDVRLDADLDTPLPNAHLPLPWIPQSVRRYLNPTALVQSGDQRIAELARSIIGNDRSESGAAQAISLWLQQRIGYSFNQGSAAHTDAITTYATGAGICEGWAHLFLALARSTGIPCRYVGGFSIGGDISYPLSANGRAKVDVSMPSLPHAWVEVWYPNAGWVPYDPQTSAGFVDTHHVPIWTGLDGNATLPILTWQLAYGTSSACSFAEQETTSNTSDNMQVYCGGNFENAGSGADFLFSR